MFRQISRAALALALIASCPAIAPDLDARPALRGEPRHGPNSGGGPVYVVEDDVLFWRSYGWPGGQVGPCWRRWYGQWIWSC